MAPPDENMENQKSQTLLIAIKQTLDHLKEDSKSKDEVHSQTNKTLDKVQTCMSSIKIDLTQLKSEQRGFIAARKDRALNCDKLHVDFEQRLRDHPAPIRCKNNESRLQSVEKKIEGFIPLIYKVIGGVIVISIIVPPLIAGIIGYLIKKWGV